MTHLISAISTPQPVLKDVLLFVTLLFFLTSSLQQHALYRAPFHSLLLPSGFYCPVLCLTSLIKFPHVIKLHFQRRNSLQSLPDLSFFPLSFFFLFPPGSVCAHQPVGLCFRACLCLDRFMKLCGICQNKKTGEIDGGGKCPASLDSTGGKCKTNYVQKTRNVGLCTTRLPALRLT